MAQDYYEKIYKPLIGFKIVGYKTEDNYPTFVVQRGNEKYNLVVSQDAEGNGGGFMFIEEH
jgi:hypothetical protein